ncbi:lysoplasmalogenase [Novosphingobium sp. ZN18A2]|uniref:lysoplasmalogenase n=1 Tax=Novosphingobium sp. ZN18A2 TaxID=3079861 RepID=UPI0030CE05AA
MPHRALAERRPWLLASLFFGVTFWFVSQSAMPGIYQIAWKGAGVAMLAGYAWAHHPSRDAHLLAIVMALSAIGDMALEVRPEAGVGAFFLSHLAAIALYARHRRVETSGSQKALAVLLLVVVPLLGYILPVDRGSANTVAFYALALAGMAGMAWTSSFPRYRVGLGALMFVASDLLIFAKLGPLADARLLTWPIWPLYYFGQFLIATGVIGALRKAGEFSAE